jgi:type VI secretion system protein ImpB
MRYDPASKNGDKTLLPEQAGKPLTAFKERKYVQIDRDNFNDILKSIGPRLSFQVKAQTFAEDKDKEQQEKEKNAREKKIYKSADAKDANGLVPTKTIELEFKNVNDFNPINVVKQVRLLRDLFDQRALLSDLLTKLEGNEDLAEALKQVLASDNEALQKFKTLAQSTQTPDATTPPSPDPAQAAAQAAANASEKAAAAVAAKAKADAAVKAAEVAAQKATDATSLKDSAKLAAKEAAALAQKDAEDAKAQAETAAAAAKAAADEAAK